MRPESLAPPRKPAPALAALGTVSGKPVRQPTAGSTRNPGGTPAYEFMPSGGAWGVFRGVSNYFIWLILSQVTGSPVASGVAVLLFLWGVDRYTLGVMPDPFRWLTRLRKQRRLETHLRVVPHDRKARFDLAELYLWRRQYAKAVDVLRPNLEAGDDNIETVFTMGVACLGAGHLAQGEKLLAHALEMQKSFRNGEIHLELGRFRVERGDFSGAKEQLEQLISLRKGTVEGRVLLARALEGLEDDGAAALMRDQAWAEHEAAPRFQQRRQRLWAWRARPSRPASYAVALALLAAVLGKVVVPALPTPSSAWATPYGYDDFDDFDSCGGAKVDVFSYRAGDMCTEIHDLPESYVSRLEQGLLRQPAQAGVTLEVARAPCSEEGAWASCQTPKLRLVWHQPTSVAVQTCQGMNGTLTVLKTP